MDIRPALTREQVRNVIEFRGCEHIPVMYHFWCGPRGDATQEWRDRIVEIRNQYPQDVNVFGVGQPGPWDAPADAPRQRWAFRDKPAVAATGKGLDSGSKLINDLAAEINDFLADKPDPDFAPYYVGLKNAIDNDKSGGISVVLLLVLLF